MAYANPRRLKRSRILKRSKNGTRAVTIRHRRDGDADYDEKPGPVRVPPSRQVLIARTGIFGHKQTVG